MTRGRRRDERGVLDEAGGVGAMTGVMAIMVFLTVLAAALALATAAGARSLDRELAGRLSVVVTAGDAAAARVRAALAAQGGIAVRPVGREALTTLLRPWLGDDAGDAALPVPTILDVTPGASGTDAVAAAVRSADPTASIERHENWMAGVATLLGGLTWLGAAVVALMAAASAAVVVLAARAGLETHRATIEVMHMMGATDVQVARLFQRRLALDAAIGGSIGTAAALTVTVVIGDRLAALGSQLIGGVTLSPWAWAMLVALPAGFVALATVAARVAVLRALGRML